MASSEVGTVYVQCKAPDGRIGTFLAGGGVVQGDPGARHLISPICADCVELFAWARGHGWVPVPGTLAGHWRRG